MYKNQFFQVHTWIKRGISICLLSLFILLLFQSKVVLSCARQGLTLWAVSVVPALLPFIILSRFWIYYNIPDLFIRMSNRLFHRTPAVAVSLPLLVLGLTCGFPIGAIFIRHFYERKYIGKTLAEDLLPLCSFVSPMFLAGYVFSLFPGTKKEWHLLLIALYLPIFLLYIDALRRKTALESFPINFSTSIPTRTESTIRDIWLSSLEIILTVGIYMMLFSILFGLGKETPFFSGTAGSFFLSCLEVTTGSQFLMTESSVDHSFRILLLAGCLSFGGVCTGFQVKTAINGSNLSMKAYYRAKVLAGVMSMLLFWILGKIGF